MQSDERRHAGISNYRLDNLPRYCRELFAAQSAFRCGNLRAVFSELLGRLEQYLDFDHLSFALHDPTRNCVNVLFEAGASVLPEEVPVIEPSLGIVLHQQLSIEVEDIRTEKRFPHLLPLAEKGGFRSFLSYR